MRCHYQIQGSLHFNSAQGHCGEYGAVALSAKPAGESHRFPAVNESSAN